MSQHPGQPDASDGEESEPTEIATDGLVDRIGLIEAQPLAERAARFEQLHDELLAELQRSDHGA